LVDVQVDKKTAFVTDFPDDGTGLRDLLNHVDDDDDEEEGQV
jgi:hypothetical protein